jgi:YD repeat-containing protein
VFLDAKRCAEGQNCSLDRTFTFATPEYGSGRHYVEAVVTDGAGNTTRRGFNVENPAGLGESQLPAQKFGLENYFHYDSTETGLSGAHVNLGTGNAVFHRVPMMNPGRGISSVLNLSYNSYDYPLGGNLPDPGDSRFVSGEYDEVGLGWSLALSGLTRINEPLGGVAVSGTPNGAAPPARITLTDPDGTLHTFTAKTDNGELFAYKPPPGVNLRLRAFADQLKQIKLPEQHTKAYAITRPDGITYFFDGWGFLRSIEDRNHNVMSFEYETTLLDGGVACGVVVPGVCEPRLKRVVDAAGNDPGASAQLKTRRSFTFDYYPLIGSPHSGASGRISTITDHAGRQMTFTYNSSGFLTNTAEAPGTSEARRFTFTYDQPDLLKDPTAHPQLRTITDPRGNSSQILYEDKARLPLTGRAVRAIYNRRGNFRSFGYNKPEQENTASNAYVTDARGKPWAFALDGRDRLVSQHDPLGRITGLEWDSDNNVISHTEAMNTADQATTLFTYNQNGALTSQTDPLGRITALTYRDSAGVHRSDPPPQRDKLDI